MEENNKEEIRQSILILALNNLIQDYTYALESKDIDPILSKEGKELADLIIKEAKEMLRDLNIENTNSIIQRPKWK